MPTYKLISPRFDNGAIILVCDCTDINNQIRFTWYPDDEDMEGFVSIQTHLTTNRNFIGRLWYGLKYAFGFKSRYGAFDELLAYKDDVENLIEFLKEFLNEKAS